jgi:probable HAF family extracellular repeat protein
MLSREGTMRFSPPKRGHIPFTVAVAVVAALACAEGGFVISSPLPPRSTAAVLPSCLGAGVPNGDGCAIVSAIDIGSALTARISQAMHINDRGQVAGYYEPEGGGVRGFFWEDGVLTELGTLGGSTTQIDAMNERGQVVGLSTDAAGFGRAFLWDNGTMRDLGTLGGPWSWAMDINAGGVVVGVSETSTGEVHAFRWENGVMMDLEGPNPVLRVFISDNDIIAGNGWFQTEHGFAVERAFRWQKGTFTVLDAYTEHEQSMADGISRSGEIMGWHSVRGEESLFSTLMIWRQGGTKELVSHPGAVPLWVSGHGEVLFSGPSGGRFIWDGSSVRTVDLPPDADIGAINDRGQGVGAFLMPDGTQRAMIWDRGRVVRLGELGGAASQLNMLNNHGQAVGAYAYHDADNVLVYRAALWNVKIRGGGIVASESEP